MALDPFQADRRIDAMVEKWIDRGKDAAPALLTPKALELAHVHAEEQRERAERAEARVRMLEGLLTRLGYDIVPSSTSEASNDGHDNG